MKVCQRFKLTFDFASQRNVCQESFVSKRARQQWWKPNNAFSPASVLQVSSFSAESNKLAIRSRKRILILDNDTASSSDGILDMCVAWVKVWCLFRFNLWWNYYIMLKSSENQCSLTSITLIFCFMNIVGCWSDLLHGFMARASCQAWTVRALHYVLHGILMDKNKTFPVLPRRLGL